MKKTLATYRREAGFNTQEELAMQIGVERNSISRWETGEREPRLAMIPKLAAILGISEGEIIAAITAAKADSA